MVTDRRRRWPPWRPPPPTASRCGPSSWRTRSARCRRWPSASSTRCSWGWPELRQHHVAVELGEAHLDGHLVLDGRWLDVLEVGDHADPLLQLHDGDYPWIVVGLVGVA